MDSYTKLALDWLAHHPNPTSVTADPTTWAEQLSDAMAHRIRELTDRMAPPIPDETFVERLGRVNAAGQTATEMAIDELLPSYPAPDGTEDWIPLLPDISDLL